MSLTRQEARVRLSRPGLAEGRHGPGRGPTPRRRPGRPSRRPTRPSASRSPASAGRGRRRSSTSPPTPSRPWWPPRSPSTARSPRWRPALQPVAVAGHSLGEYSALVAAGALDFADALRLVRRRGELMQEAVPVGEGAMAAIIGLDPETIAAPIAGDARRRDEVCAVANLNGPAQTVIAGAQGGDRPRRGPGQGARRAQGDAARRLRPLPFAAHAPGPGGDGAAPRARPRSATRGCRW